MNIAYRLIAHTDGGHVNAGEFYSMEMLEAKLDELVNVADEETVCETYHIEMMPRVVAQGGDIEDQA